MTTVTVVIVATEVCDPRFSVTAEGSTEHAPYGMVASGVQVRVTEPAKPFVGATLNA